MMMSCELFNCDYRSLDQNVWKDAIVITDPPYAINFKYDKHIDREGPSYDALLEPIVGQKLALLQYPEDMMKKVVPILGVPEECIAWCYNSNLARQFRIWGIWNCKVDFNAVRQPYKNPTDKRVKKLIEKGSAGTRMYDWFSDIQLCKNVSSQKTKHPCQLPEELIERVIRLLGRPQFVFYPFMGSGTTGAVCKRMGIDFIGCEVSEQYFDICRERMK